MKSGSWQLKAVLIAAGVAVCVAAGLALPKAMLWYAKRQAMQTFAKMSPPELASINCVLAKDVKKLPPAGPADKTNQVTADGYRFILPAETFRRSTDANESSPDRTFHSEKVKVRLLGVASKTPDFPPGQTPSNAEVTRYFRQAEPYQVLVDAFNTTPADLAAADTHAAVQKSLYLLLLKVTLETFGCEKLWQQVEAGGRKGIVSGDVTCKAVIVDMYCPETKEFAGLAIFPAKGVTMDEVYRCIGQIRIERDPAATRPAGVLGVRPWASRP